MKFMYAGRGMSCKGQVPEDQIGRDALCNSHASPETRLVHVPGERWSVFRSLPQLSQEAYTY